jgi:hypothetical protein
MDEKNMPPSDHTHSRLPSPHDIHQNLTIPYEHWNFLKALFPIHDEPGMLEYF